MRDALHISLQYLRTRKFRISLAVLLPAFFVLFVFGPMTVAINGVEKLLYRGASLPADITASIRQTLSLLTLVMWVFMAGALTAGLALAYSILAPIRKVTADPGILMSGAAQEDGGEDFAIFGTEFSALMGSVGRYVSLLEGMSGGVVAFDQYGRVTAINPSAEHIFGCSSGELLGKDLAELCRDVVYSSGLEGVILEGLRQDRQLASKEIRLQGAGGRELVVGLTTSLLKDGQGKTVGVVANIMDLTGLKRMHDELQKKLRMASIGRLAAGVAHEVRNPLGAIKGMAQLIQEGLPQGDSRRKYGLVIEQEADRLNRVVTDLLGLVHRPEAPAPCALPALITQARELASFGLGGKNVELIAELEAVPEVEGEHERLLQAFLNLFLNAFEAVPEGGRVRYKTAYLAERGTVRVEIGNTGPRIPPDDMDNLFEPFFTTKERGSGLGLAIVHQIVTAHSGAITVQSTDEETVFCLELPVSGRGQS
jgi:PAS domain S-box-containing protein